MSPPVVLTSMPPPSAKPVLPVAHTPLQILQSQQHHLVLQQQQQQQLQQLLKLAAGAGFSLGSGGFTATAAASSTPVSAFASFGGGTDAHSVTSTRGVVGGASSFATSAFSSPASSSLVMRDLLPELEAVDGLAADPAADQSASPDPLPLPLPQMETPPPAPLSSSSPAAGDELEAGVDDDAAMPQAFDFGSWDLLVDFGKTKVDQGMTMTTGAALF